MEGQQPLASLASCRTGGVTCVICGTDLTNIPKSEPNCPTCNSPSRTRSLVRVRERVSQILCGTEPKGRSLLAFALTGAESKILSPVFGRIKSVSLYGRYGKDHEVGVDVRNLDRYSPASFDGVFGCLLFDYFEEHEQALGEIERVLKPGGVFFTHIASYRLTTDAKTPPQINKIIQKRKGYFEYVPDDAAMPSVNVGADWLLGKMKLAGFEAERIELEDQHSGEKVSWFVAIKPLRGKGDGVLTPRHVFPKVYHEYFSFPKRNLIYCRNVLSGFSSVLEAIDLLAVAEGVYKEPLSKTINMVRDRFRIKVQDISEEALTFTVVQNPFRRLASVYTYGIVNRRFFSKETNEYMGYEQYDFNEKTSFCSFVRAVVTIPGERSDDFITPQSQRLFSAGVKRVRFIARLETIEDDWAVLMRWYGGDLSLPHRNSSKRVVEWTEELRELVYQYYRDDFRIFGYAQDSVSISPGGEDASHVKVAAVYFDDAFAANCARKVAEDNAAVREEARPVPAPMVPVPAQVSTAALSPIPVAAPSPARSETSQPVTVEYATKEYSVPLPKETGFKRVILQLCIPQMPTGLRGADFAEHVLDANGEPTDQVILCGEGVIGVTEDLGKSWRTLQPVALAGVRLWNSFTLANGKHLMQAIAASTQEESPAGLEHHGKVMLFNKEWGFEGSDHSSCAYWHGSASIGQAGGTIMFAEYQNNGQIYRKGFDFSKVEDLKLVHSNAVFRSRNGGLKWEKVFEQSPRVIRHFHTLQPDRFVPGRWWLSSGDQAQECHVWRSDDDGDSWIDVSNPAPDILVPTSYVKSMRACQRYTDLIIEEDSLLWGADDYMGALREFDPSLPLTERSGSRLYMSPKTGMLQPQEVGYIGHPVRSLIDVGPGWIILTEAKHREVSLRPGVFLLFKEGLRLIHLFEVDNYIARATGFSYSRASRKGKDGTFFSFRSSYDAFPYSHDYPRMLKWHIEFE